MTYCGDHYAIYTYIESLCYTPKANIMLYVNNMPIKKLVKKFFLKGNEGDYISLTKTLP